MNLLKPAKNPQDLYILDGYGDGSTPMDLARACGKVWPVAKSFIGSPSFQMATEPGEVGIKLIDGNDFDHNPTSDEVLAEIAKRGLADPMEEDALRFGKKYPDLQKKRPIVFLYPDHPTLPWRSPGGHRHVLVLGYWSGERRLGYGWFGYEWGCFCLFAARVPRK